MRTGQAEVWEKGESVLVTQITRLNELVIWLASGKLDECIELHREVQDAARAIGVKRAHIVGRRGWAPVLRSEGWRPRATHLTKEL